MFLSGGLSFGFQVNMFVTTASDRFYILTPSLSIQNNSKLIICLNLVLNSWFTRNTICVCFDSFSECRSKNEMPSMYPQAKGILHAFKDKGVNLAIASRSPTPDIANAFLQKLGIKSMFVAQVRWWKSPHLFLFLFWGYDNLHFFSAVHVVVVHLALCLFFSGWLSCDRSFRGRGVGQYASVSVLRSEEWKKAMRVRFAKASSVKWSARFFPNKVLFSIRVKNIKYA